jgi:hypothetical protein
MMNNELREILIMPSNLSYVDSSLYFEVIIKWGNIAITTFKIEKKSKENKINI